MMNVSLPPHLEQLVRSQLATGQYQSESDVIAAAIRLLSRYAGPSPDVSLSKRSPRGILADLHNDITPEEIRVARREMWSGLFDGEA